LRFRRPRLIHRNNLPVTSMSSNSTAVQKRTADALAAIKAAYGTEDDEFGATLFVSHHLEEIEPSCWEKLLGTATPEPRQILDALVLKSEFEQGDEPDSMDFTLPDEVTDYVICVAFNEDGVVDGISMES
jgi:Protein of unknown function (DUF2004)